MPQLLISEDDLMTAALPDYQVRSLDEYSSDDLSLLLHAIAFAHLKAMEEKDGVEMHRLEVWATRIKMAVSIAGKREQGNAF